MDASPASKRAAILQPDRFLNEIVLRHAALLSWNANSRSIAGKGAVRQQDDGQVLIQIYPKGGTCIAKVPSRVCAEILASG